MRPRDLFESKSNDQSQKQTIKANDSRPKQKCHANIQPINEKSKIKSRRYKMDDIYVLYI